MPYSVRKSGGGYKVTNKDSGKTYSKKPLSKAKANAQMRAIYANTDEAFNCRLDRAIEEAMAAGDGPNLN